MFQACSSPLLGDITTLRHWCFMVGALSEQADWEQEELIRRCDTGRNGLPETYEIQPVTSTVLCFDAALRNWHP